MIESTAFASSGEEVITRPIDVELDRSTANLSYDEFTDYYEIDRTVDEIIRGDYKRVSVVVCSTVVSFVRWYVLDCVAIPR
jgi:diphthamide biosynthesis protein 2